MSTVRDLEVAKLCVERGYASPAQVQECLRETDRVGQTLRPLEAVLRHRGYISEDLYQEISSSFRRPAAGGPRTCGTCGTAYGGELCPRCVAGFAATPSAAPEGSSEGTTKRAVLDPEVAQAAADPKNRFGKYILLRELGAGGMGVVFKAWQSDLRRTVALKFIRGVQGQEDLERFLREAQLAATLSHPGIAPIYEIGEHDGKHFFAMQFVDGQTFDRLMSGTPRPPIRKLVELLAQAAEAVQFAHEHGVIHRDLKPQNLMVDPKGRVYVMDFGLAKSVRTGSSLTGSGFAVGTPSYMAPEQAEGDQAKIGPRSDVYGLGAILYQIGAGRAPFEGPQAVQVLLDVVRLDPVPPRRHNPRFHPELETVALRALEKDPERRFQTAAEFAEDLRRWLEGEPIRARPAGALSRILRRIRKQKVAALGIAALALGLATAGGTFALRSREKSVRSAALPFYEEASTLYGEEEKSRLIESAVLRNQLQTLRKAEASARRATELDPSFADAHVLLGQILQRKDMSDSESQAQFSRAIELEPGHLRARLERGLWRLNALTSDSGIDSVSQRTGTSRLQFQFAPPVSGADARRTEVLADLEAAGRMTTRESEKALLEGATEFVSWKPGDTAALDRAEERLKRAGDLAPNDPEPRILLGQCRLLRDDRKGAADYLTQALRFAPNDCAVLYRAAMLLMLAGRTDEALAAATRSLEISGPHAGMLGVRGSIHQVRREIPEAIEDFKEASRLRPQSALPYGNLGGLFHLVGRHTEAVESYTRALERRAGEPDYLEGRALSLLFLDRLEEAERDIDRVIEVRPTAASYCNRGAIRARRGQFDRAMEDYGRAEKLDPQDAGVPYNVGLNFVRRKKHVEAVERFRRAVELGRDLPDTWLALGQSLNELSRFPEAEDALTRSLALNPGDPPALMDRGRARAEQGNLKGALEDDLAALPARPQSGPLQGDLGILYAKLGQPGEAIPHLERAVAAGKKDLLPLLGEMLLSLDRTEEAEAAFSRSIEAAADPKGFLGRARIRHAQGRLAQALEDLDAAVRTAPNFAPAIGYRGVVRLGLKKPREAAEDLRRAIELDPKLHRAFKPFLDQALEADRKE